MLQFPRFARLEDPDAHASIQVPQHLNPHLEVNDPDSNAAILLQASAIVSIFIFRSHYPISHGILSSISTACDVWFLVFVFRLETDLLGPEWHCSMRAHSLPLSMMCLSACR